MLTPIGPSSPVNLPTVHRADGLGEHDLNYWLSHPADALDEIDRIDCEESLLSFTKRHWHILEPGRQLSIRWPLEAVCEHLEAVTYGQIKRLLINVPPGFMKSLLCNVFWPAWEWGALGKTSMRYVNFSYSAHLTERDNRRFRDVMLSHDYGRLFGDKFALVKTGEQLVSNDKTGWKLATSVGGVGTGERGDRVVLDDPHNVKEGESEQVRISTTTWFREAMNNRVNDRDSAIVVIMQRIHDEDVSGVILNELRHEYEHLCIPYEWEGQKLISTVPDMAWNEDPRTEIGQEAWPARLPTPWRSFKITLGPYAVAAQYQQRPTPRGGGIIRRDWWQLWDPPPALVMGDDGAPREVQRFPQFEFVVASLDGAFGQKQENDWTALTVWGVFRHAAGVLPGSTRVQRAYAEQVMGGQQPSAPSINPAISQAPQMMLMHAWRKRLPLNGLEVQQEAGESDFEFRARQMREWGIVQWVIDSCKRRGVNMLLVESKANGIDVANEVRRQMEGQRFGVKLIDPGRLDKVARAYAVQHIWADRMVWYPDREWADEVISEMSVFPKGAHDDYCFVGETMIATKRGSVPIRDVVVGDMVVTPDGWRKVTASTPTGVKPVMQFDRLVGTGNHPIFTFDRGYHRMDTAMQETPDLARLSLCGLLRTALLKSLSSTVSCTDGWEDSVNITYLSPPQTRGGVGLRACMSQFGNFIRGGQFRKAMKFTTSITTHSISSLKIWSAFRKASIAQCLSGSPTLTLAKRIWSGFVRLLASGTSLRLAGSGIGKTQLPQFAGQGRLTTPILSEGTSSASGAARSSSAGAAASGSATQNAKADTMRLVYNLTVEGAHCYYANGILVHNCDTATQAAKWLRDIGVLQHAHEMERELAEAMSYKSSSQAVTPLYPV